MTTEPTNNIPGAIAWLREAETIYMSGGEVRAGTMGYKPHDIAGMMEQLLAEVARLTSDRDAWKKSCIHNTVILDRHRSRPDSLESLAKRPEGDLVQRLSALKDVCAEASIALVDQQDEIRRLRKALKEFKEFAALA